MLTRTEVDLGYIARAPFVPFHKRLQRWAVIVAHRRAGKTVACVLDLIDGALRDTKDKPRYSYIAPQYKQAKSVAWDYLRQYGLRIPGATAHETELRLDLPNGGRVRLFGADNPDSLRGLYHDGVILDEAADMSPRVYTEVIRPSLSDRGGWCTWIGTPKGQNEFYDLWEKAKGEPDYFALMLRASETGIIATAELADARRQMTLEQYAQEYECSFQAAILGAYYGREMEAAETEKRIASNVYDPTMQVHTAWDLGHSDQTAIWFYQSAGFEIRVIDFYSSNGCGLDHYVGVLQDKARRPGNERGYTYGTHYLPHDVGVTELGTGRTRIETLRQLGLNSIVVVPKLPIDDGINAVRKILPRCWFDQDKCAFGLKALRQYRRDYDDVRKTFMERPYHDWASDPADAFRYLAVGLQEPHKSQAASKLPKPNNRWVY